MTLFLLGSLARAESMAFAVERVVFDTTYTTMSIDSGELVRRVEGLFATNKLKVALRPSSYFDANAQDTALRLGLRVVDTDCMAISEDAIRCRSRVEFELLHAPSQAVVYRSSSMGQASGPGFAEALARSVLDSAGPLIARKSFLARLEDTFYPAIPPRQVVRACAQTTVGARLSASGADLYPLDEDGQVLVVGTDAGQLSIAIEGGPTLLATRLAGSGGIGVYDLPVEDGIGCVGDEAPLTRPQGGVTTVGEALAHVGTTRTARGAAPTVVYDKVPRPSWATYSEE